MDNFEELKRGLDFICGGGRQARQADLSPNLPRVMADPQRVVRVLGNLRSNVVRQAPETIFTRVAAKRDGCCVRVSVAGEGQGFPPDQPARLFDQHARLSGREGDSAGRSLGLVVCKGLVEAHGGRIEADCDGLGRGPKVACTPPVTLAATDHELLRVLSVNAARVLDDQVLLRQVWGERDNPNGGAVRRFIKRPRQRLGERASRPKCIFNQRGVGYRMATPADPSIS